MTALQTLTLSEDSQNGIDASYVPAVFHGFENANPHEVLVVLPALNEVSHISACIRSLMSPDGWMLNTTIVVVDGGSTDGTLDTVRDLQRTYPNLILLDNPAKLQSAGINLAVSKCAEPHHRILVRCDVHALYPPGFVKDLAEKLYSADSASIVTAMDANGQNGFQRATAWIVDTPLGSGGAAHRGGTVSGFVDHGHHAAFDLRWFKKIGGYDPTFSHNEDAEFDIRLAQAGGRIWLASDIRVGYVVRPSIVRLWRQYWNYGRGRASTIGKHKIVPRLRQMAPVGNIIFLALSCIAMFFSPLALIWPASYLFLLFGTSVAGMIVLRSYTGFWAGPALAAMHIAWGLGFCKRLFLGSETAGKTA